MSRLIDLTGMRFGQLVVQGRVQTQSRNNAYWRCSCDCGAEKIIIGYNLTNGHTKSCGCLVRKVAQSRATHGMSKSSEYSIWSNMILRTTKPSHICFKYYGGRGIRVCKEWRKSFAHFLADVGPRPSPRHSLERLDRNGHYEPGNVIWAEPKTQARNRSNNHIVRFQGLSLTVVEWAERIGIPATTLFARLQSGKTSKEALTMPLQYRAPRLSPENIRQMAKLVAEGWAQSTIAKQFGLHQSAVSKAMKRYRQTESAHRMP